MSIIKYDLYSKQLSELQDTTSSVRNSECKQKRCVLKQRQKDPLILAVSRGLLIIQRTKQRKQHRALEDDPDQHI